MHIIRSLFLLATLAFSGVVLGAETPTLDEVEKAVAERAAEIKSLTADVHTVSKTPLATSDSKGKIEYAQSEGKELIRYAQKIDYRGVSQSMILKVDMYINGDQAYSVREVNGETIVIPQSANSLLTSPNGLRMLELAKAGEKMTVLPEAEIDGKPMFVVQVDAPPESSRAYRQLHVFIDKKTGVTRRMRGFGPDGSEVLSVDYTDVALNPEIDQERFKFVMPEGAKVLNIGGAYRG